MNAVEIHNLTKVYASGTVALKGIDLTIPHGDFYALLGANGAGKTTTLGILTSLVHKSGGSVSIYGIDIDADFSSAKRFVGLVPQEFNFNIFEKVMDIVVTQAGYFGIPRREAIARAEGLLKQLGLWEKRMMPSRTLSGGMKRRLMIARALIHRPRLLILDEPTAGVDVELRHDMWDYLKRLNAEGTTILLTTHYLEEAEQLCRNVAIIKEGSIVKQGPVKALISTLESRRYLITPVEWPRGFSLQGYDHDVLEDQTISVVVPGDVSLSTLLEDLSRQGLSVADLRPTVNRLEQLFLNTLKQ